MSAATQTREVPGVHEVAAVPRGATACYKVTTASLRIREAPNNNAKIVGFLKQGQIVRASTTVTVGFRELGPHRWSGSKFLAAVNAHC
ncbi:hypothetical protein EV193_102686 [Herbihabitans rhizosphaerae]|uniref:SH3 domain-containing protein n=2 Tax=Herbihabitans rhizosphaerae TaxID=1872711 RepID=A0A4Q7L396_9PSEU|nr:hypothetical protein EV193_102686 [Herbihabitans rhizosphaerae]